MALPVNEYILKRCPVILTSITSWSPGITGRRNFAFLILRKNTSLSVKSSIDFSALFFLGDFYNSYMIKIKRLVKSFRYAIKGLVKTVREEQNLQIQGSIALIAIILAIYFKIDRLEWALLIFVIGLVILMEIANSAIERITDVLKPRINGYVKEIKDIMAAAVMLASIVAVIVGLIIFWPYIF